MDEFLAEIIVWVFIEKRLNKKEDLQLPQVEILTLFKLNVYISSGFERFRPIIASKLYQFRPKRVNKERVYKGMILMKSLWS